MPKDFIYETSCTLDHETGELRVDTTREGIAAQLRRMKFREVTRPDSKPYRRFIGEADQIRFRKPKADRPLRGFARKDAPKSDGGMKAPEKI
jgi:hypothetical protein